MRVKASYRVRVKARVRDSCDELKRQISVVCLRVSAITQG